MKAAWVSLFPAGSFHRVRVLGCASGLLMLALAGCGGSGSNAPGSPAPKGDAQVVLMLSSTANDKLTSFNGDVTGLSLTSQSGNTVTLFSSAPYQQYPEFVHLNGFTEPFLTTAVPQDTYISATVTMGDAQFSCATYTPGTDGGLSNNTYSDQQVASNQVTVTLPQPIVISVATGLSLELQEASSVSYGSCALAAVPSYTITPAFQLKQLPFGDAQNALANGEPTTVNGVISAVGSGGTTFNVSSADGPSWSIAIQPDTTFQGVSGASALAVGQPVNLDILFGTDGSIEASRVQVLDSASANLSMVAGPVEFVADAQPSLVIPGVQEQGYLYRDEFVNGGQNFSFGSAKFQIAGYLTNLQQMPFTPAFTAANMVPGQNIVITSEATAMQGGPVYVPASTVTLMPQTVNGTITNIQASGQLTTYTVSLAQYDLFQNLANQPGQSNQIASPGRMTVYVSGGNLGLESQEIAIGQPFRFTGLVFNDNGALKMDCLQILAGVAE